MRSAILTNADAPFVAAEPGVFGREHLIVAHAVSMAHQDQVKSVTMRIGKNQWRVTPCVDNPFLMRDAPRARAANDPALVGRFGVLPLFGRRNG